MLREIVNHNDERWIIKGYAAPGNVIFVEHGPYMWQVWKVGSKLMIGVWDPQNPNRVFYASQNDENQDIRLTQMSMPAPTESDFDVNYDPRLFYFYSSETGPHNSYLKVHTEGRPDLYVSTRLFGEDEKVVTLSDRSYFWDVLDV